MSSLEDEESKRVEPRYSFSHFLWKWLDRIQELRFQKKHALALETFFQICDDMPSKIYHAIKKDLEKAKKIHYSPIELSTSIYLKHSRIRKRKITKNSRANVLLSSLLRKFIGIIEKREYLEKKKGGIFEE